VRDIVSIVPLIEKGANQILVRVDPPWPAGIGGAVRIPVAIRSFDLAVLREKWQGVSWELFAEGQIDYLPVYVSVLGVGPDEVPSGEIPSELFSATLWGDIRRAGAEDEVFDRFQKQMAKLFPNGRP